VRRGDHSRFSDRLERDQGIGPPRPAAVDPVEWLDQPSSLSLNPSQKPLLWTAAAVILAALTAYAVARQTAGHHEGHFHAKPHEASGDAFHEWLHSQLEITPEQESQLAPIERSYAEKRGTLLKEIEEAGHQLATALDRVPVDRPGVDFSLGKIHDAQGELQQVTIGHFLEMKEGLSPEQAAKLLRWTRESITHEHRP